MRKRILAIELFLPVALLGGCPVPPEDTLSDGGTATGIQRTNQTGTDDLGPSRHVAPNDELGQGGQTEVVTPPTYDNPGQDDLTKVVPPTPSDESGQDDKTEIVPPPDAPQVRLAADWRGDQVVNIDINWKLPDWSWFPDVSRSFWSATGAEAAVASLEGLSSGVHEFQLKLEGERRTTNCEFEVDFLNLQFAIAGLLEGPAERKIVAEVADGEAITLFNGWLPANDPNAGGPSGLYPAETQVAWRNADANIECGVWMRVPDGTILDRYVNGLGRQGFERARYPRGPVLEPGTYQIDFDFRGRGSSADVTHFVAFPGFDARFDERMIGPAQRMIRIEQVGGAAQVLFNGWRAADAPDAGGLTGAFPVEVLAGWREASDSVNVDIDLQDPDGVRHAVWRNGSLMQGFEFLRLSEDAAIKDGQWKIRLFLHGGGRTAQVKFDARFANWSFSRTVTLSGGSERVITLSVSGGQATPIFSSWE